MCGLLGGLVIGGIIGRSTCNRFDRCDCDRFDSCDRFERCGCFERCERCERFDRRCCGRRFW